MRKTKKKKMNKYTFYLPKIETRTTEVDGVPEYIIKGYATVPNHVYSYGKKQGKNLREFFTDKAVENIRRKIKTKGVYIDLGHQISSKGNIQAVFDQIKNKTGANIEEEEQYILSRMRDTDIPMFKVNDLLIDEKGLFVDIRANPFYQEVDEEHKNYFSTVWNSLDNGYINSMSLDMDKDSMKFTKVNDSLFQIDDADVSRISLCAGGANDMANITEVAMRCFDEHMIELERGESKCQMKRLLL